MSAPRLHVFAALNGKLVELAMPPEQKSTISRSPRTLYNLVVVGCRDGACETILDTLDGQVIARVDTTQARKVAEAALAVMVVHAMAYLGEVAIAMTEAAAFMPGPTATLCGNCLANDAETVEMVNGSCLRCGVTTGLYVTGVDDGVDPLTYVVTSVDREQGVVTIAQE